VTLTGDIFPITLELTLRGIYDCKLDNESLFFHFKYLNESLEVGSQFRDVAGIYSIRMERSEDASIISKTIDDKFHNSTAQTRTETEQAFQLSFLAFLGNVKLMLLSICAAVTFTILLVTGNTMAMAVRERAREVGVLKTLGFTNGMVLWLMVGEALAIGLIGGAIGLGVTRGLILLLSWAPAGLTFLLDFSTVTIQPTVIIICLLVAGMVGLVSSIIPALGASRRSIVEALKVTD
jgi:putative ABC transport system permease protein